MINIEKIITPGRFTETKCFSWLRWRFIINHVYLCSPLHKRFDSILLHRCKHFLCLLSWMYSLYNVVLSFIYVLVLRSLKYSRGRPARWNSLPDLVQKTSPERSIKPSYTVYLEIKLFRPTLLSTDQRYREFKLH